MAENKNGTWKIVATVSGIMVALLAAAVTYGMLSGQVEYNYININELKPKVERHDTKIAVIETRQQAIFEGVQRIEKKLESR